MIKEKETINSINKIEIKPAIKTFHIYSDATTSNVRGIIKLNDQPIAIHQRDLDLKELNKSTLEKELISILELIELNKTILEKHHLIIHFDRSKLAQVKMKHLAPILEKLSYQFVFDSTLFDEIEITFNKVRKKIRNNISKQWK